MDQRSKRLHPPQLSDSSSPWLVYTHGNAKSKNIQTFSTFSPSNHNQTHIKSIPALRAKFIFACFDDWLLLRDMNNDTKFFLWNIVTSELHSLPALLALEEEENMNIKTCALVNDDHDNNSCLVLFLFCEAVVFFCRVIKDSAATWARQTVELDGGWPTVRDVMDVVTYNGVLYCRVLTCGHTYTEELITTEFAQHDPNFLIFKSLGIKDPPYAVCVHSPHVFQSMVESNGVLYHFVTRLAMCDTIHQIVKIIVWQLDLSLMSWVPVEHLGNRTFFLGDYCSTWCYAESSASGGGFEANCVYLASEGDSTIYSYRLEDDSFSFLSSCPTLLRPFYGPFWIMPQHLRLQREFGTKMLEEVKNLKQGSMVVEHRELDQQNELGQNLLINLPHDVITLISKHLHWFDYLNFRISCKTFFSILPRAQWIANNSLPLFMYPKDDKGLCELRDPCRNDSLYIMIPHSPTVPVGVDFCKDGWLIVCTKSGSFQFFNPFTRMSGNLPPVESMHAFTGVGFSTCPTSSDCLTVGIEDHCINHVAIRYLQSGDETWEMYKYEFDDEDSEFKPAHCSPVYYKEAFYFLDQHGYLGSFKLVQGSPIWAFYESPDLLDDSHSSHLLECDGKLLSVFIGKVGRWIQVFKFNYLKEEWKEIQSLGKHSLFIGPRTSFSASVKEHGIENRIYLPWLKGNDLVFYSLKTRKYHTDGGDVMEDFYGLIAHSLCCWV